MWSASGTVAAQGVTGQHQKPTSKIEGSQPGGALTCEGRPLFFRCPLYTEDCSSKHCSLWKPTCPRIKQGEVPRPLVVRSHDPVRPPCLSTVHNSSRAVGGTLFKLHSSIPEESLEGRTKARLRPALRGQIREFSARSRRALMNRMNEINREKAPLPSFVTLTYPDEVLPVSAKRFARDMNTLRAAWERRFGKTPLIWRKEGVRRKSGSHVGELVPHVHMLPFGVEPTEENRDWITDTWVRITGGKGQPWERKQRAMLAHMDTWSMMYSWRQVMAYVSKYCAKISDEDATGRCWAVWNLKNLPREIKEEEIPQDAFHAVRRVLRKLVRVRTGREPRTYGRWYGLTVYMSEAMGGKLCRWAWDVGWSTEGKGG